MKKRILAVLLAVSTVLSMTGCQQKTSDSDQDTADSTAEEDAAVEEEKEETDGEVKKITFYHYKVDTIKETQALMDLYCESHPGIEIEVQTVGGTGDYKAVLKQKASSGELPDIICNDGASDLDLWVDKLVDLTDEPWVQNCTESSLEAITKDGKVYGQPITVEGYGYIYNKELFEQAGITEVPRTISEFKEVCEKLVAAGITPFVNTYAENWVVGQHFLNGAGLCKLDDALEFCKNVGNGEVTFSERSEFSDMLDLLKMTYEYGDENALGLDYNTGLNDFATGKGAMIQQGVWIQPTIDELNPDLEVGMFPFPINDNEEDNVALPVGVTGYYAINNESPYVEECKDILNWMVTEEESLQMLNDDFQFMLPLTNVDTDVAAIGQLYGVVDEYTKADSTTGWYWFYLPSGFTADCHVILQKYLAGELDKTATLEEMDKLCVDLRSQS